jgi:hypothetical protein
MEGADIYQIAKNCRPSVEIEKFYASHIRTRRYRLGRDGKRLLQAIAISDARESLGKLDPVTLLERMWEEQFVEENGQLRFREVKEMTSPATWITPKV